jgi:hypothetical protein
MKIRLSFMLFFMGIFIITNFIINKNKYDCNDKMKIKYVPRDVYDEILKNSILFPEQNDQYGEAHYNEFSL